MEAYQNPNLVMNKPEIFLNLKFNLEFAEDTEVRQLLKKRYILEECAYPNVNTMQYILQTKADLLKDEYNQLYKTTLFEYNPIENYDLYEESQQHVTQSGNSSTDTLGSQFPMDKNTEKPVTHGVGSGKSNSTGDAQGTLRRHGNIGVTSAQKMIEQERALIIDLLDKYVNEYTNFFMLTI